MNLWWKGKTFECKNQNSVSVVVEVMEIKKNGLAYLSSYSWNILSSLVSSFQVNVSLRWSHHCPDQKERPESAFKKVVSIGTEYILSKKDDTF